MTIILAAKRKFNLKHIILVLLFIRSYRNLHNTLFHHFLKAVHTDEISDLRMKFVFERNFQT